MIEGDYTLYIKPLGNGEGDVPTDTSPSCLSLLSDSNQRPRDYKSRALAN